jgi:hypothetical protein
MPSAGEALRKLNHKMNNYDKYEEIKDSLIMSTLHRNGILSNSETRRLKQRK